FQRITPELPGILVQVAPRLIVLSDDGMLATTVSDIGTTSTYQLGTTTFATKTPCTMTRGPWFSLSLTNKKELDFVVINDKGVAEEHSLDLVTCLDLPGLPAYTEAAGLYIYTGAPRLKEQKRVLSRSDIANVLCAGRFGDKGIEVSLRSTKFREIDEFGTSEIVACAYSPDGLNWMSVSPDGFMTLKDLSTDLFISMSQPSPKIQGPWSIAITNDSRTIAATGGDGRIELYRNGTDEWMALPVRDAAGPVALDTTGNLIAYANSRREVEVWRIRQPVLTQPPDGNFPADLIEQLNGPARRTVSDELVKRYERDPSGVIAHLMAAILPDSETKSYRVNLYILRTLARIKSGWRATDADRTALAKLRASKYMSDPTYKGWADQAIANMLGTK
ncbi:MAG: WD40 repeat domain-containing protein, partial [Massilia sp.]